jgi:hypothetical protein
MERLFNGALALLSMLLVIFTFAFAQYLGEEGRPITQRPYLVLTILSGGLLVATGAAALVAHLEIGLPSRPLLHYLFAAILLTTTLSPVILWLLR